MESKSRNTLTLLLIAVIVIIVGIIGYLGFEIISGNVKENNAREIAEEFDRQVPDLTEEEIKEIMAQQDEEQANQSNNGQTGNNNSNNEPNAGGSSSGGSTSSGGSSSSSGGNAGRTGTSSSSSSGSSGVYINGLWVLGKITIPATGLKDCPIFTDARPTALDKGVGIVTTANGLNKPGNTVIAGHNYRNRLFFSRNKNLVVGNLVTIKDTSGLQVTYEIYNKFITNDTDASFYTRDTAGKREITLSTCTDDGTKTGQRIIIFAREK